MKRQLVVATSLALLVFATSPSFAVNGDIGIFADQGQAICATDLALQQPLTLYVYAQLKGGSLGGITGVEYRISQSAVTDWSITEDLNPANADLVFGTAIGVNAGLNLAWAQCQTTGPILLETIEIVDLSGNFAGVSNTLRVEAHSNPSNQFFRCPLFVLCDDPVFTKLCLGSNITTEVCPFPPGALACFESTSGEFFINPPQGFDCTVAVSEKTWSQVKSLYGN